jgi:tetratricopeptide (TPR) repeat protein
LADFYEILGLNQSADSTQIRTAYKRLAMQYHPDRNPGNPQAEEMFKAINEAYHVLSDSLKKSRYDSRFTSQTVTPNEAYWREAQRRQYAQWQYAQKKRYVFDIHYFKIQGLAFLVFIIMSGISFGIFHTASYFISAQQEKVRMHNKQLVMEVNSLFGNGKIDEAITRINTLHEKDPLDFQFTHARDSLVNELRDQAEKHFELQEFDKSLPLLKHLKKYEFPPRVETLRKISVCQYNLGVYEEALQTLNQLYAQQPWNLELVYQMGVIQATYLKNSNEAMNYFAIGKKLFKENLTEIYGEAFSIVMNPKDVPDIYADIFVASAITNIEMKKYKEALKDLNWAIYLRHQVADPYKLRAQVNVKLRHYASLCNDLAQAKKLGAEGIDELQNKYCR